MTTKRVRKNYLRDLCIKCEKECNSNSTGLCQECRSVKCHYCQELTTSKKNPAICSACTDLTAAERQARLKVLQKL